MIKQNKIVYIMTKNIFELENNKKLASYNL